MELEEDVAQDRRKSSVFERHLQTGLVLLAVGLLGWNGVTTSDTSSGMAVLDERVSWMGGAVSELKTQISSLVADRYTQLDAERDRMDNNRRFENIETRLLKLENMK